MGKIIGIANPVKASGRTLSAVNLSASLALLEKRVLIVDCDTEKKTSEHLGFTFENYEYGLDDILTGFVGGKGVVARTRLEYLFAIPAGHGLDEIEDNLFYNPEKERVLEIVIDKFREDYDYIIFDTPGDSGLLTRSVMIASDEILVPLRWGPDAETQLSDFINVLTEIDEKFNLNIKTTGILLVGTRGEEAPERYLTADQINRFKGSFYRETIPEITGTDENQAGPACLVDIKSRLAAAYLNTAYEFLAREMAV